MKTFIHRFFWKTDTEKFSPWLPFMAILNLAIGLIFGFGSGLPGVTELQLFAVLSTLLPDPFSASIWGIALVLVFIGHCLEMYFRGKGIGPGIAMSGFLLWCYALYIYLSQASIMGVLAIALPQLFFWGWYYIESKTYKKELELDLIEAVS